MGTVFNFQVRGEVPQADALREATRKLLEEMENSWSRFRADSELSQLNAAGRLDYPSTLFQLAIFEASSAYRLTQGRFDPRVKAALTRIGYERSFADIGTGSELTPGNPPGNLTALPNSLGTFRPYYDIDERKIECSAEIDLGGIGKGLALRLLDMHLRACLGQSHLIEAGGDIITHLATGDHTPWFIDIESPFATENLPILVRVGSAAIATTSTKVRNWKCGGSVKHHIIDPTTMDSAESDLIAVTVIESDSARAEVLSKWLFLLGLKAATALARERCTAALLVGKDSGIAYGPALVRYMEIQGPTYTSAQRAEHFDQETPFPLVSITP